MSNELLVTRTSSWWETLIGSSLVGFLGGCMWSWAIHVQQRPVHLSLGIAGALLLLILAYRRNDLIAGPGQMTLISFLQATCILRWGVLGFALASFGFAFFELWVALIDKSRFISRGMASRTATTDFLVTPAVSFVTSTVVLSAGALVSQYLQLLVVGVPTSHSFWFTVTLFFGMTVIREILEHLVERFLHRRLSPDQ